MADRLLDNGALGFPVLATSGGSAPKHLESGAGCAENQDSGAGSAEHLESGAGCAERIASWSSCLRNLSALRRLPKHLESGPDKAISYLSEAKTRTKNIDQKVGLIRRLAT